MSVNNRHSSHQDEESQYEAVRLLIVRATEIAEERLERRSQEILHRITVLGETFSDIAREMIPDITERSLNLGQMSVARAARKLFSQGQYEAIAEKNKLKGASLGGTSFHPQGFDATKGKIVPNGHRSLWSNEELQALRDMKEDTSGAYLYDGGLHSGRPSFTFIASLLNEEFKGIRPPRTANAYKRMWDRLVVENDDSDKEEALAQE